MDRTLKEVKVVPLKVNIQILWQSRAIEGRGLGKVMTQEGGKVGVVVDRAVEKKL
jgi:hypothetical protein